VTNAVSYERPALGGAVLARAHLDARYVSSQNTGSNLAETKVQPGYTLVNGRVGVATPDERWAVEVWGRNLFDENYAQIMFDIPLPPGAVWAFLGARRTYGMTLRARY
jgi:outer membrane receptor protein involved in Fe transport